MVKKISLNYNYGYMAFLVALAVSNNSLVEFCLILYAVFGLVTNKTTIEMAFMVSLVLKSELTCFALLVICVSFTLFKNGFSFDRINPKIVFCIIVIAISSCINTLFRGGIWGPILGGVYYALAFFGIKTLKGALDEFQIYVSMKFIFFSELVASIFIIVLTKNTSPGDLHKGTFSDAHYFSFWLVCFITYLFVYCKNYIAKSQNLIGNIKYNLFYYFTALFLIIISDGKNVLLSFILALFIYGGACILAKSSKNRVIISILTLYIGLFVGILMLNMEFITDCFNTYFPNISLYVYNPLYSYKYQYFEGTLFEELNGINIFFGFGIGQYGSRFANLFAYDCMYRDNSFINNFIENNFYSFVIPEYYKYASLFSEELVKLIPFRSAVLSYPFSSLIAFIAEFGIIGLACLIYILVFFVKKSKYVLIIIFLFSCCIFDSYFEHVSVLFLVFSLILVSKKNAFINLEPYATRL